MKNYLSLLFLLLATINFSQEVELVIPSGLNYPTGSAISHNNKYIATGFMTNVSVWEIKTGRLIRTVKFSDDMAMSTDSVWFSEGDTSVITHMMTSNNHFSVNIETGKSSFIEGAPMDWIKYVYKPTSNITLSTFILSAAQKELSFQSPDKKSEVVFKKIKNPFGYSSMMPFVFEAYIRTNGKLSEPIDSSMMANYCFSPDFKRAFINNSVFDLVTGRKICDLKMAEFTGLSVGFLPNSHIPITACSAGVRVWDFPHVKDIAIDNLVSFVCSPNKKFLIGEQHDLKSEKRSYVRVDLEKLEIIEVNKNISQTGQVKSVNADASLYTIAEMEVDLSNASLQMQYNAKLIQSSNGSVKREIDNAVNVDILSDQEILVDDVGKTGRYKYSISSKNKTVFPSTGVDDMVTILNVSADKQHVLGYKYKVTPGKGTTDLEAMIWEASTGNLVFKYRLENTMIMGMQMSPNHQLLTVSNSHTSTVHVIDIASRKELFILKGHTNYVTEMAMSDDSKRIITASMDGTRRVWDLESGKELVSMVSTGKNDYAIITPDQYYFATKGAKDIIHFVKGKEIFPFSQFDLKYNRPDKVLEKFAATNTDLIRSYNMAYQKRLKRMGFTEDMLSGEFHMPVIEITNQDEIPVNVEQNQVKISVTALDTKYTLNRMIVRVNGVPIHGRSGIPVSSGKSLERSIEVPLIYGENAISISVLNEKGVESIASNLLVRNVTKADQLPVLHLCTIGMSYYQQSEFDLKYASKDAKDLSHLFDVKHLPFSKVVHHDLSDQEVNVTTVNALKDLLNTTNVNDVVCVFYAGHGLLDADLNYYLASYKVQFKDPKQGGIPYEVFEDILDGIPARKKLVLLDACHSGEIDKEEMVLAEAEVTVEDDLVFRSMPSTGVKQVGLNNSFELMKELFADIRKGSGTMVISSAGGTEYAMEGDQWRNGVFTYSLLNGLTNQKADLNQDGQVMMSEVSKYVREEVSRLTNGKQQPTNRVEVIELDFRLW